MAKSASSSKYQKGLIGIFIFILILVGFVALLFYADSSKVGDPLFFLDEGVEGFQLSFSALNAGEKFQAEAKIAQERLLEAKQLSQIPGRENDYHTAISKYNTKLSQSETSLEIAEARGFDISFLPSYLQICIDNLNILADLYQTPTDNTTSFLDQPIQTTLYAYKQALLEYRKTQSEEASLKYQSQFLDVQEKLELKQAPFNP